MKQAIAAVLTATLLTGCDGAQAPSKAAEQQAWRLTRDGVVLQRAGKLESIVLPGWIWVGAPYCPPDLAVGPHGEAVITSNVIPTLWRVDPQTLAVTVHSLALDADAGKDVGFSGLVYSAEQGSFFAVSEIQRSAWRIDASLTTGRKIGASQDWKANFRAAQRSASARMPCVNG